MICYLLFLGLLVFAPVIRADKNITYELRNIESLKDCKCNFTLELVRRCENKIQLYNETEMDRCIKKCSESKSSKKCNCETSNEFRPVCGNDGITYPNPSYIYCTSQCKNSALEYAYDGICREQVLISSPNKPTSEDQINLSKELLDILKECKCAITYDFNPTCGSDGITYVNPSMLYCAKRCKAPDLKIEFFGNCSTTVTESENESKVQKVLRYPESVKQCLNDCPVSYNRNPVCGSDGYTYDSLSELACHNSCTNEDVGLKYHGFCEQKCKCEANNKLNPVCGSDGITYYNPSTLLCAEKCNKSDLRLLHCGFCKRRVNVLEHESEYTERETQVSSRILTEFEKCGCIVTREYEPICGIDGVSYENPSIFYCTRKCINPSLNVESCGTCEKKNKEVNVKHNSKTEKSLSHPFMKCDCVATAKLYPVCGNDGISYPHPSYLYCIKDCKTKSISTQNLQILHCGSCKGEIPEFRTKNTEIGLSTDLLDLFEKCHCNVTRENNPVCGMDGITYDNPSIFYCIKKCKNKEIHIQYCGKCQQDTARPLNDEILEIYEKCRCTATREYEPMCGNDGINYANPKVFECAKKCFGKKNMSILYNGLCSDPPGDLTTSLVRKKRSLVDVLKIHDGNYRIKRSTAARKEKFLTPLDLFYVGCNCFITTDYEPVCGTDGNTYTNVFELSCYSECKGRGVLLAHHGPCKSTHIDSCECIFSKENKPVCGSDGKTYRNPTYLDCFNKCENKNVEIQYEGSCGNMFYPPTGPNTSCDCKTTYEDAPLCGTDGRTYYNPTHLKCSNECGKKNVKLAHEGRCLTKPSKLSITGVCDCKPTYEDNPVCGSDGRTYHNPSQLKCAQKCGFSNVFHLYQGSCVEKPESTTTPSGGCDCPITGDLSPVCGSDGKTYENPSKLECINKCENKFILLLHNGPCGENPEISTPPSRDCNCSMTIHQSPICGSNGKTYANPSVLECYNKCEKKYVFKLYDGECRSKRSITSREEKFLVPFDYFYTGCNCLITPDYHPVCGSDGNTYTNIFQLSCHNECRGKDVYLAHHGSCPDKLESKPGHVDECKCITSNEDAPVCGSDKRTYRNPTHIKCFNECEKKNVKIAYQGSCGSTYYEETGPTSCNCTTTYEDAPLCGSDERTYYNPSHLKCTNECGNKNVQLAYKGRCLEKPAKLQVQNICNCMPTYEDAPVCGSDGRTYHNPSQLKCAHQCGSKNVFIEHQGPCIERPEMPLPPSACNCQTATEYSPVCGSDGKTYQNPSVIKCTNECEKKALVALHQGACQSRPVSPPNTCPCKHSYEDNPLCGSDGRTYHNPSHLKCTNECAGKNILLVHPSQCQTKLNDPTLSPYVCNCYPTTEDNPICGSDGNTYRNPSQLKCTRQCENRNVVVSYDGPCFTEPTELPSPSICNCLATFEFAPVCGSDGKTYRNPSHLKCAGKCGSKSVTKAYDGNCIWDPVENYYEQSECTCTIVYEQAPICGTDFRSYSSPSYLDCVNKCERRNVTMAYIGVCHGEQDKYPNFDQAPPVNTGENCTCLITYGSNPVCASNGQTYSNAAFVFCLNKCRNQALDIVQQGPCKKENTKLLSITTLLESKPHIFSRLTEEQKDCLNNTCPRSYDFEAVCGSDGITYENRLQIVCARNCYNPDLFITSPNACLPTLSNDFRECNCQKPAETNLVCGNDGRIYPHPNILECVKNCKLPSLLEQNMKFCGQESVVY